MGIRWRLPIWRRSTVRAVKTEIAPFGAALNSEGTVAYVTNCRAAARRNLATSPRPLATRRLRIKWLPMNAELLLLEPFRAST